MVFSSIIFLWFVYPLILCVYFAAPKKMKNAVLVFFSILFYAWGEPKYIVFMIGSVLINFSFGLWVEKSRKKNILLTVCIVLNLLILGYFKYSAFAANAVNHLLNLENQKLPVPNVVLPIGISFYTFQALSYVVDVYRGENKAQKNILNMMLYISFFPQLIAGPIVKYHDIEEQIKDRSVTLDGFSYGIKRFITGLGKKVLLANAFAEVVDKVFSYQPGDVSRGLLWLTAILYMMQIYFDFSGYSDMAIGLGKMFGFTFQENFNYPYLSVSIRDFWRRWHISLSSWFREYVYIPLGGNRKGRRRTYINLWIVFFLTGLWHGAGWTFIFWGLFHGFFIVLERAWLGRWLEQGRGRALGHLYTMIVVLAGWIIFRSDTLSYAGDYIWNMLMPHRSVMNLERFFNLKLALELSAALLGCGGFSVIRRHIKKSVPRGCGDITWLSMAGYLSVLWTSIMMLVNNTYNPFIYFRF